MISGRKTSRAFIVALASVAIVGLAACKKSGSGAASGAAGSAVSVLPKDTGFLVGISFKKLRETKLWETIKKGPASEGLRELDTFKEKCSIDAVTALDQIVIAGTADMDEKKTVVLVSGSFDKGKLNDCLVKLAKEDGKDVQIKEEGKITVYSEGGESVYAAWLDGGTALVTPGDMESKARLEEVLAGKSSVKDNKELMGVLDAVDTNATLWGAALIPEGGELATAFAAMPKKPGAGYLQVNYKKDLDFKAGLRFADADGAKQAKTHLDSQLEQAKSAPMVGTYMTNTKVDTAGKDTIISLKLTEQQLDQITQSLLPMFMMMGGGGF